VIWHRAPLSLALTLAGCYSASAVGRARVVAPGELELFVAPEALGVAAGSGASIRPIGDAGARYGAAEDLELDFRVTTLGASAGPRLQVLRSPSTESGFDLLIAPALAYTYPDKLAVELPFLVGWNLPGEHQLIIGARLAYQLRFGVPGFSRPIAFVLGAGSVGFVWRISGALALVPELAVLRQIYAEPGFSSNVAGAFGLQSGIGLLFDL
jgi:hypothetical protein